VALLVLLTLRGTPFLYQGDEIGLTDGPIERADVLDAVGTRFWPYYKGRDPERTPMPWHSGAGGGFSPPGVRTWLPMADPAQCNVADQEGDPASALEFCRRAIAARAASDDLTVGLYRSLASPEGTWAYARGDGTAVLLNMSDTPATFDGVGGTVTVGTEHTLEGSSIEGALSLGPWSGAVVAR
jgi:alpha-glucosidase